MLHPTQALFLPLLLLLSVAVACAPIDAEGQPESTITLFTYADTEHLTTVDVSADTHIYWVQGDVAPMAAIGLSVRPVPPELRSATFWLEISAEIDGTELLVSSTSVGGHLFDDLGSSAVDSIRYRGMGRWPKNRVAASEVSVVVWYEDGGGVQFGARAIEPVALQCDEPPFACWP